MNGSFWNFSRKSKVGLILFFGLLGASAALGQSSEQALIQGLVFMAQTSQNQEHAESARLALTLSKSLQSYASVNDYTALFLKQERSEKGLDATEQIFLKFEKPFKIYMKWLSDPKKGLEVHYERGKHEGKLAIHKPGFLTGLAGVIFLDQNSPWVRKGSESYNIEDAGIGTFLFDFSEAVLAASESGCLKVHWLISDSAAGNSADVTFDVPGPDATFFARRCVVFFDSQSQLPVRMELFDWENNPTGVYDYKNLKLNLASPDPEFKKQIHRSLYKVYNAK